MSTLDDEKTRFDEFQILEIDLLVFPIEPPPIGIVIDDDLSSPKFSRGQHLSDGVIFRD